MAPPQTHRPTHTRLTMAQVKPAAAQDQVDNWKVETARFVVHNQAVRVESGDGPYNLYGTDFRVAGAVLGRLAGPESTSLSANPGGFAFKT